MRRLIWSPAARGDLAGIEGWFAERDPAAGIATLRAIRATLERLCDYPRMGRAVEEPFRALGVRGTAYILVYRLREDAVEIIRVLHGRENWLPVEGDI